MSSGLPSSLGRTSKAGESSTALAALAECRRQREQQEQLLLKAQEELQKAARLAKTAIERRVGGPEPPEVAKPTVTVVDSCEVPTQSKPKENAPKIPRVRPALRGALRRQKSESEAPLKSEGHGVSASLRAAAALSPHRGFYHGHSPRRRSARTQTTSGRLAWADAPTAEAPGEEEEAPQAEATEDPVVETETVETVEPVEFKSSPSWKRLEKTVTQYVSRRNVTQSEYEQVRQRYEGHLNELKVLCETVGRPTWSDKTPAGRERPSRPSERSRGTLNFRDLQDEKDFRDVLELRDPRPRQATSPRSTRPRSPLVDQKNGVPGERSQNGRGAAEEAEVEKSVVPPLLSARMLSAVPMALLHQDNDLEHVKMLFSSQVPEAQVLSVYRVENPTLAGVYSAVRDAMGSDCELDLWHGTSSECVPNIVLNGFNRAYSGRRHGTKLGHGSYFSASAAYSTRFCDRKRQRRTVFFAKVLVGAWAKGSPELVEPPCKDSEGLLRYDCTVDDPESPVNFCIFRDFQAMPTYLLEFLTS